MDTYKEIQIWVKDNYHFTPKPCWIADVKENSGLIVRKAPNRIGKARVNPCPSDKIDPIQKALKHFGLLND